MLVSGTWISDRPEAEEHPVVPIGLNEMAVPRISILASFGTIAMLLLSAICLGLAKGLDLLWDNISCKLILKKLDVTFCILSMLITLLLLYYNYITKTMANSNE